MSKAENKPTIIITRENLSQFEPISSLSNERLDELVSLAYLESVSMGVSLFREGDVDNQTIYVLKGDVQLSSSSAKIETTIQSNSKEGRFPLDDSQPRLCSAVAMSSVEIIRIDNSVLDYMMMWDQLAVAEITENKEPEPNKEAENTDADNVEKLVEQAVLDSINNAREQDDVSTAGKVDFTQTIKPELIPEKVENRDTTNNKKDEEKKVKVVIDNTIKQDQQSLKKNKDKDQDKEQLRNNQENTRKEKNTKESNTQEIKDKPKVKKQEQKSLKTNVDDKAEEKNTIDPYSQTVVIDSIKTIDKKSEDKTSQDENPIVYESRDWIRKIRQIMAFKNMPPANIKNLLEKMESINVSKGDKIIEQGNEGDYYYVITDGTAVVTRTIELASLAPGTSFGEEALVAKSPRNASVSMTSDGILMRLSKSDFDELLIEPMMARVSPEEARSKVLQGAKWLDVRHAKEFHHSRLPGAINIPLHELRLRMTELDKDTEYICCCRTGARSSSGSFLLAQNGFKVSLLTGG
ncbi:MAG: cyclic nucleotide-binding domain-containing protein, partial [Thiohalomonadales bacterium]